MAKKTTQPKLVKPTIVDISKKGPQYYSEIQRLNNGVDHNFELAQALNQSTGAGLDASDYFSEQHASGANRRLGDSQYDAQMTGIGQMMDANEFRAQSQGALDKIGNGVAGFAVNAAQAFTQGTIGTVWGIGSALVNWDGSKFWNNEFSQAVNSWSEIIGENYETREDQAKEWWQKLDTANFWGSAISNLGFMAGAMAAGALTGGLIGSAGAVARLGQITGSLAKARLITGATGAIFSGAGESAMEAVSAMNEMREQGKLDAENVYYEEFAKIEQAVSDGRMSIEDANVAKSKLYNSYENGLTEAENAAVKGGNMVFALNTALSSAADFIQFGKLFSGGFASDRVMNNIVRRTVKDIEGEAVENAVEGVVRREATGTIADGFKRYAGPKIWDNSVTQTLKGPVTEFLEEQTQGAIVEAGKLYTHADVKNTMAQELNQDEFYNAKVGERGIEETNGYFESIAKGLAESYGGSWEEGFHGFLTGLMPIPIMAKKGRGGKWKMELHGSAIDGYKDYNERKSAEEAMVEKLNARVQNPEFLSFYEGLVRHKNFQHDLQEALNQDSEYNYQNTKQNQLISDLMMFDNAGQLDALLDHIDVKANISDDQKVQLFRDASTKVREMKNEARENAQAMAIDGVDKTQPIHFTNEYGDNGFAEEIQAFEQTGEMFDEDNKEHVVSVVNARMEKNRADLVNAIKDYRHIKNEIDAGSGGNLSDEQLQHAIWSNMIKLDSKRRVEQYMAKFDAEDFLSKLDLNENEYLSAEDAYRERMSAARVMRARVESLPDHDTAGKNVLLKDAEKMEQEANKIEREARRGGQSSFNTLRAGVFSRIARRWNRAIKGMSHNQMALSDIVRGIVQDSDADSYKDLMHSWNTLNSEGNLEFKEGDVIRFKGEDGKEYEILSEDRSIDNSEKDLKDILDNIVKAITATSRTTDFVGKDLLAAEDMSAALIEELLRADLVTKTGDARGFIVNDKLSDSNKEAVNRFLDFNRLIFRHNTAMNLSHEIMTGQRMFIHSDMESFSRYVDGIARRTVRMHADKFKAVKDPFQFEALVNETLKSSGFDLNYEKAVLSDDSDRAHIFKLWSQIAGHLVSSGINPNANDYIRAFNAKVKEFDFISKAFDEFFKRLANEGSDPELDRLYKEYVDKFDNKSTLEGLLETLLEELQKYGFDPSNYVSDIEGAERSIGEVAPVEPRLNLYKRMFDIAKDYRDQYREELRKEEERKKAEAEEKKKGKKKKDKKDDKKDGKDDNKGKPSGDDEIKNPDDFKKELLDEIEKAGLTSSFASLLPTGINLDSFMESIIGDLKSKSVVRGELRKYTNSYFLASINEDRYFGTNLENMEDSFLKNGYIDSDTNDRIKNYRGNIEAQSHKAGTSSVAKVVVEEESPATSENAKGMGISQYDIEGSRNGNAIEYTPSNESRRAIQQHFISKGIYKYIDSGKLNGYNSTAFDKTLYFLSASVLNDGSNTDKAAQNDVVIAYKVPEEGSPEYALVNPDAIVDIDGVKYFVVGVLGSTTSVGADVAEAQRGIFSAISSDIVEQAKAKGQNDDGTLKPAVSQHTSSIEEVFAGRMRVAASGQKMRSSQIASELGGYAITDTNGNEINTIPYKAGMSQSLPLNNDKQNAVLMHFSGADGRFYSKVALLRTISGQEIKDGLFRELIERMFNNLKNGNDHAAIKDKYKLGKSIYFGTGKRNIVPFYIKDGKMSYIDSGMRMNIDIQDLTLESFTNIIANLVDSHPGTRFNMQDDTVGVDPDRIEYMIQHDAFEVDIESTERFNASFTVTKPSTLGNGVATSGTSTTTKYPNTKVFQTDIDGTPHVVRVGYDEKGNLDVLDERGNVISGKLADVATAYIAMARPKDVPTSLKPETIKIGNKDIHKYYYVNINGKSYFMRVGSNSIFTNVRDLLKRDAEHLAKQVLSSIVDEQLEELNKRSKGQDEAISYISDKKGRRKDRNKVEKEYIDNDNKNSYSLLLNALNNPGSVSSSTASALNALMGMDDSIDVAGKINSFTTSETDPNKMLLELIQHIVC